MKVNLYQNEYGIISFLGKRYISFNHKMFCFSYNKKKKNLLGSGGGRTPRTPVVERFSKLNRACTNLMCAYNLYVEFHYNQFIIIGFCFRGSVNMGPVDPLGRPL